jgi:hypothetical protein
MTESIINLILKLRRRANDKASSPNEVAAAAKAADKLIHQHRITEAQLQESENSSSVSSEPVEDPQTLYETNRAIPWKIKLIDVLVAQYGCATFFKMVRIPYSKEYISSKEEEGVKAHTGRYNKRYILVGTKSDIEIVRYMFAWLSTEIERMGNDLARGRGYAYSQSYKEGVVIGIEEQFKLSKIEEKAEAETGGYSTALVKLENRGELAQKKITQLHPDLKTFYTQSYRTLDPSGLERGIEDGKKMHLGKALPKGANTKLLK